MRRVLGPVVYEFGHEVPYVEPEYRPFPHGDVAPRRGVEVTVVEQADSADGKQPPSEVRIFAVELD